MTAESRYVSVTFDLSTLNVPLGFACERRGPVCRIVSITKNQALSKLLPPDQQTPPLFLVAIIHHDDNNSNAISIPLFDIDAVNQAISTQRPLTFIMTKSAVCAHATVVVPAQPPVSIMVDTPGRIMNNGKSTQVDIGDHVAFIGGMPFSKASMHKGALVYRKLLVCLKKTPDNTGVDDSSSDTEQEKQEKQEKQQEQQLGTLERFFSLLDKTFFS